MPDIKDTVGDGGKNKVHDVALVQVMLRLIKDGAGKSFLTTSYDGVCGSDTKSAIARFQAEHKLITPDGKDKTGVVAAGGPTVQKLGALLPATSKDLRVLENSRIVYVAGAAADAKASETSITAYNEFEAGFRGKVADLVRQMFATHGIVLWVTPTGRRRTFAQQFAEVNTNAGPGESNHNFGRAVDIGFDKLQWLLGDGTVKQDSHWLNALEKVRAPDANLLWDARDAIATKLGLFRLQFERVHLQGYDQATASSQRSLVKLLNTVGKMQWKTGYQCDLGCAGKAWFGVGTAKQVWSQSSAISRADIAKARSAATGKAVKEADIKPEEVTAMKRALKADFEAADQHWIKWTAVV